MIKHLHFYFNTNNPMQAELLSKIELIRKKYQLSYTAALMTIVYPPENMINSKYVEKVEHEKETEVALVDDKNKTQNENKKFLKSIANEIFSTMGN